MIILLKFLSSNIFDVTQEFKIVMKWEIRVRYKKSLENLDDGVSLVRVHAWLG